MIDLVSSDEEEPTIPLSEEEVGELPMPPPEDVEEEVLMPPLEVEEELHVYVGPLEGDEMQQGEDVHVPPHGVTVEPSSGQRRRRSEDGEDAFALRRVFPRSNLAMPRASTLPRFAPLVGPSDPFAHDIELNHPSRMDLDATYFYMLSIDLPDLFGFMTCHANRQVKIRALAEFSDWLHVVSDPIVVRVYVGRDNFRVDLVEMLRVFLDLTLIYSNDSHTLLRKYVNVFVSAMSQALHALGGRICRVSFFGMK